MRHKAFFAFSICLLLRIQTALCKNSFTVSPVEFHPGKNVADNVDLYEKIINEAFDGADILVFPESTLFARSNTSSLVPDPKDKVIPYADDKYNDYKPIQRLSQAAAKRNIYVVVNLREVVKSGKNSDEDDVLYNTNVVFDRNGAVIARYRKYNLFDEIEVKKPNEPELVTFDTDFGITFGMFTCFDILFEKPAVDLVKKKNIKHLIFPSYWFSELPFLTAAQVQAGWSYAMDVNLVAAGANNPSTGSTGTGCYQMRRTFAQQMYKEETTKRFVCRYETRMNKSPASKFADVVNPVLKGGGGARAGLTFKRDPTIGDAVGKVVNASEGEFSEKLCSGDFCCSFSLRYQKLEPPIQSEYTYKALAYRGRRNFGLLTTGHVEYCAVVLCRGDECGLKPPNRPYPLAFDKIEISASVDAQDTLHFPSTLMQEDSDDDESAHLFAMSYSDFRYELTPLGTTANVSMELARQRVNNLVTFGIYGRNFNGGETIQLCGRLLLPLLFLVQYAK